MPSTEDPARQGSSEGRQSGIIRTVEQLADSLAALACPSMVLVCVGHELRGDDAAGTVIGQQLAGTLRWKVYNALSAPESFLMKIVADQPESVLTIDAIDLGAEPGAMRLFQPEEIAGQTPSTHGPGLTAYIRALEIMHPCRHAVLGIQPQHLEVGRPLSEPVRRAVDTVVRALRELAESINRSG